MRHGLIFIAIVLCVSNVSVNGNGILKSPVGRSSMWRFFGAASYADQLVFNRNDTQLNCGGNYVKDNADLNGKCGHCGDPQTGPFENEYGSAPHGIYVTGHPSAVYREGAKINVTVTVTVKQRGGFFMMYLCPTDSTTAVTESCFQQNRLTFPASSTPNKLHITDFEGDGSFEVRLPTGVTCDNCVMRWVWITASKFRCDPTGLCGMGYWDQPAFVNCADVKILKQGEPFPADFEYPDYQSLYASMDDSTTVAPLTTPLTIEPLVNQTTTGIPVVTVTIDPTGPTGTTEAPPNVTEPIVGPVIPALGAAGGISSAGLFPAFIPFAGLSGLAGLGLGWFGKRHFLGTAPNYMIPPPPAPMVGLAPYELFGGPAYVPEYRSYGSSKYTGYGNNDQGYHGYGNNNYGNNNYGYRNANNPHVNNYNSGYKR